MYESQWAGIVYGRSYHLDFRLIAIPEDFNRHETNWALEHIIPTTRAASKLAHSPRWSLFKNEERCIVGVTCMVRDLIGDEQSAGENFTKDAQGRPLYVFVGYGTKITHPRYAINFPIYEDRNLNMFQPLYQYVREQWLAKDSGINRKKTSLTNYQKLSFTKIKPHTVVNPDLAQQLNCQGKYANKIFLWQNLAPWNKKLWLTAAICKKPTSLCLGSASQKYLLTSPFLNGTVDNISEFTIQDKLKKDISQPKQQKLSKAKKTKKLSFPHSLEAKVKKDLHSTFQQAGQAVHFGQELVQNIIGKHESDDLESVEAKSFSQKQDENFGFKAKKAPSSQPKSLPESEDWF